MRSYLAAHFGESEGALIADEVDARLKELAPLCRGKSENQQTTMNSAILPRIALYQVLQQRTDKKSAYDAVWDYTKTVICGEAKQKYLSMEKLPFFFLLFKKVFLNKMTKSDNWDVVNVTSLPDSFGFDITRCLWYDTCKACGCPELCRVFCDSDWENFGGLHKAVFSRTKSLGTGGDVCNFAFKKG